MNFIDAAESGLKKWVTFSGRASRSEYWWFVLFYFILIAIINISQHHISEATDYVTKYDKTNVRMLILCMIGSLGTTFSSFWLLFAIISVFVRRMHDTNHSGWWYWIWLTIIGALFPLFVWKCTKGTEGPNRYGPDPLQGEEGNLIR